MALRTPLYDRHVAAGARMVEFGGYDMPLQYSTIRDEHIAVRTRCGLFDLSHMGEVRFTGDGALDVVQRLVTNDVARLEVGGALYGVMCHESGGIVDDVVVYREADGYMVVINAACRDKDVAWMGDHSDGSDFVDVSDSVALLAVQGPRAVGLVSGMCADDVAALRPFHATDTHGRRRAGVGIPDRIHRRGRVRALRRRGRRPGPLGRAPRGRRRRRPDPMRSRCPRHAPPRGRAPPLRPGHGRRHRPVQLLARHGR